MGDLLFVYGTLRPGASPPAPIDLSQRARHVARASVAGALHEVSWYPGLIEGDGRVIGDVFDLGGDAALFSELDAYEGEDYARRRISATLDDGRACEC